MADQQKSIQDLMNQFVSKIGEGGEVQKTAEVPDAKEEVDRVTQPSEQGSDAGVKPDKSQENLENATGNSGKEDGKDDELKPSPEEGQKDGGQPSEPEGEHHTCDEQSASASGKDVMEKEAEEVDIDEVLNAVDQDIVNRYDSEKLIKEATEDVVKSIHSDLTKAQGEQQVSQLAQQVYQKNLNKRAASDDKDQKGEEDTSKDDSSDDQSDSGQKSDNTDSGSQDSSGGDESNGQKAPEPPKPSENDSGGQEAPAAPAPDEGGSQQAEQAPAAPAEPEAPAEGEGGNMMDDLSQFPEEVQKEINALVDDITQRIQQSGTDISREEVLQELNNISQEIVGQMNPEEVAQGVEKAAKDAEGMELINRLEKLSADLDQEDPLPVEGEQPAAQQGAPASPAAEAPAAPETPAEGAPTEEASAGEGEGSAPEDDKDAMAAAMMDQLSPEQMDALQQAVAELQENGVPEEDIADAVKAILTEEPPEEVQKVSSEDDFNKLDVQNQCKYYIISSVQNKLSQGQKQ